jgi:hypothetical protein
MLCADKSALLRETITERSKQMRIPLEMQPAADPQQLEKTLTAFGAAILRRVSDNPVLAIFRLAIAEAGNSPEVAQALGRARHSNRAALKLEQQITPEKSQEIGRHSLGIAGLD